MTAACGAATSDRGAGSSPGGATCATLASTFVARVQPCAPARSCHPWQSNQFEPNAWWCVVGWDVVCGVCGVVLWCVLCVVCCVLCVVCGVVWCGVCVWSEGRGRRGGGRGGSGVGAAVAGAACVFVFVSLFVCLLFKERCPQSLPLKSASHFHLNRCWRASQVPPPCTLFHMHNEFFKVLLSQAHTNILETLHSRSPVSKKKNLSCGPPRAACTPY